MKSVAFSMLVFFVIFGFMLAFPGCISSGGGPKDGYTVYPKSYDREVRSAMKEAKAALERLGYKCEG